MRVLDASADIETRYGGGFVQSVDGLAGGTEQGRTLDWFFSVNGIVAELGSAEFPVGSGDSVWWDYRDWTDAMEVGAVVGAFPAPMATGYGEEDWTTRIQCAGERPACETVKDKLEAEGVDAEIEMGPGGESADAVRILVGEWDEIAADADAGRLEGQPSKSGVFARFDSEGGPARLIGLNQEAGEVQDFGPDAGLIAASRRKNGPPVWYVTGGNAKGVEAAAAAVTRKDLEHRYAAVVLDGQIFSLPLP